MKPEFKIVPISHRDFKSKTINFLPFIKNQNFWSNFFGFCKIYIHARDRLSSFIIGAITSTTVGPPYLVISEPENRTK